MTRPVSDEPTDEELMVAYQGGDVAAFDLLVGRYHARLFGFVLRLTADRAQAEDAYGEAWFRVVRAAPRWEPRQSLRSWLFRIARNCAADTRRSRTRWLRLLDKAETTATAPERPADRLEQSERAARIDAALETLPEEHRAALLLRYRYDFDHDELAAALGLTERKVRDRLSYGRRKLRQVLEPEDGTDG